MPEFSGIGGFLLNKDPDDVEALLNSGQPTLNNSFKMNDMNQVAEMAIKKAGYNPEEFVKQWYNAAIALEKKPTTAANPGPSKFGCFLEAQARIDGKITAKTSAKTLPLPKKLLGYVSVLYRYTATAPDQLSVNANEKMTLIEKDPSGWWTCRRGSDQGLVPSTYLEESIVSSKALPLPAAPGRR